MNYYIKSLIIIVFTTVSTKTCAGDMWVNTDLAAAKQKQQDTLEGLVEAVEYCPPLCHKAPRAIISEYLGPIAVTTFDISKVNPKRHLLPHIASQYPPRNPETTKNFAAFKGNIYAISFDCDAGSRLPLVELCVRAAAVKLAAQSTATVKSADVRASESGNITFALPSGICMWYQTPLYKKPWKPGVPEKQPTAISADGVYTAKVTDYRCDADCEDENDRDNSGKTVEVTANLEKALASFVSE